MFRKDRQTRSRTLPLGLEQLEDRATPALTWSVAFDDPGSAYADYYSQIRSTLLAAGADWSRYFPTADAAIQLSVKFQQKGGRKKGISPIIRAWHSSLIGLIPFSSLFLFSCARGYRRLSLGRRLRWSGASRRSRTRAMAG
jgi:hypothetical protein